MLPFQRHNTKGKFWSAVSLFVADAPGQWMVYFSHAGSQTSSLLWHCLPLESWIKHVFLPTLTWKWPRSLLCTFHQWELVVWHLLDEEALGTTDTFTLISPSNNSLLCKETVSLWGPASHLLQEMSISRSKAVTSVTKAVCGALCLHSIWKNLEFFSSSHVWMWIGP